MFQPQFRLRCFESDSAAVGSDRHRCGGRAAHAHLLLLYNQKVLLQEEEEQEREEGQGWLQHEEHAEWRGIMPCTCMLKSQSNRMFWVMFSLFFSTIIYYSNSIVIYDIYCRVFAHLRCL